MKLFKNTPEAREKYNRAANEAREEEYNRAANGAREAWYQAVEGLEHTVEVRLGNEALHRAARLVRAVNGLLAGK